MSQSIQRTIPSMIELEMKEEDSYNHEFVAMIQSPYIEVSGSVMFEGEDEEQVYREDHKTQIEIYEEGKYDQPVKV